MPKVSVIIANRNDIAMLVVTIRSCIEEFRPLGPQAGEIIVVDNSDKEVFSSLASALPTGYCRDKVLKIFRQDFPCLFTARELAAQKSSGEYILCLDSHVLLGRDCILNLVNFMDRNRDDDTLGFAHAPINWAHQHERRAVHDRDMSSTELGNWGAAHKQERTITWKGMPWICRRDWFLSSENGINGYGALSRHQISWGGGDMHIGVKPWLLGYKNWAVPCNPAIHIGPFPRTDISDQKRGTVNIGSPFDDSKYRRYSTSGNFPHSFGFLVSCYVLGGEAMMERNREILEHKFGKFIVIKDWWDRAKELGQEEKEWLDSRKVMTFERLVTSKPWSIGTQLEQTA